MTRTSMLSALVCAVVIGCSGTNEPTTAPLALPPGPREPAGPSGGNASPLGSVAGYVTNYLGICVLGARVEIMDGQKAGTVSTQRYCNPWGYDEDNGYSFNNLPTDLNVTLRATAEGYEPAEIRARPSNPYQYTTMIMLTKKIP